MNEAQWVAQHKKNFVGRTIVEVRYMTQHEVDLRGWYSRPLVMVLDNGTVMYPSSDDEGNNGGALFAATSTGDDIMAPVL